LIHRRKITLQIIVFLYFTDYAKYGNWHNGCGREYLFAKATVFIYLKNFNALQSVTKNTYLDDLGRSKQLLLLNQRSSSERREIGLPGLSDQNGGQISSCQFVTKSQYKIKSVTLKNRVPVGSEQRILDDWQRLR